MPARCARTSRSASAMAFGRSLGGVGRLSMRPPSTGNSTPVIQPASSEARKSAAAAISAGVPARVGAACTEEDLEDMRRHCLGHSKGYPCRVICDRSAAPLRNDHVHADQVRSTLHRCHFEEAGQPRLGRDIADRESSAWAAPGHRRGQDDRAATSGAQRRDRSLYGNHTRAKPQRDGRVIGVDVQVLDVVLNP